jgi:hypothetical protein
MRLLLLAFFSSLSVLHGAWRPRVRERVSSYNLPTFRFHNRYTILMRGAIKDSQGNQVELCKVDKLNSLRDKRIPITFSLTE